MNIALTRSAISTSPAVLGETSMIGPDPIPCEHVVFTDFDGVEGILVDLNTKKYYQLNETAMVIWKGLERHIGPNQIAEEIVANYDITHEDALRNVDEIVQKFQMYSLVTAGNGTT